MSKLTLMGKLRRIEDKKFISFLTKGEHEHLLPIRTGDITDWEDGSWVCFDGELKTAVTFDPVAGKQRKLHFGSGSLTSGVENTYLNNFTVTNGTIVKIYDLRTTPLTHRKIVDFVLADGNDYYNCIIFGGGAQLFSDTKKVGDKIDIVDGRFQSREYQKDGKTLKAYEVCVEHFE